MPTGTPAELAAADKEQRSRGLAYQMADLVNRIQQVDPTHPVTAHAGTITGLGFTLRPDPDGTWTVRD